MGATEVQATVRVRQPGRWRSKAGAPYAPLMLVMIKQVHSAIACPSHPCPSSACYAEAKPIRERPSQSSAPRLAHLM
jgi:hypothetical protein